MLALHAVPQAPSSQLSPTPRLLCAQNGAKSQAVKDIPTPEVLLVPTYKTDYLPTFREKTIYTRAREPPYAPSPSLIVY